MNKIIISGTKRWHGWKLEQFCINNKRLFKIPFHQQFTLCRFPCDNNPYVVNFLGGITTYNNPYVVNFLGGITTYNIPYVVNFLGGITTYICSTSMIKTWIYQSLIGTNIFFLNNKTLMSIKMSSSLSYFYTFITFKLHMCVNLFRKGARKGNIMIH